MEVKKKLSASQRSRQAGAKRRALANAGRTSQSFRVAVTIYFAVGAALLAVLGQYYYRAFVAFPPPVPIGNVTTPRVALRDGRHVAYEEGGMAAAEAKYNVLFLHPWQTSRLLYRSLFSAELLRELRVRLVSYDRPGYGQSDPFPGRTPQTEAEDIAEIADLLKMGSRFYIIGFSMGGYPAWACLRYIPERLAGVGMVAPVANFWWKSRTDTELADAWAGLVNEDRYTLLLARHAPFLLHWWFTQKTFRRANWSSLRDRPGNPRLGPKDFERLLATPSNNESSSEAYRQGPTESWYRDVRIFAGDWGFDLPDLDLGEDGPFDGHVHVWQGADDWIVPAPLLHHAVRVLPVISYHELEDEGHFFAFDPKWARTVLAHTLGLPGAGRLPPPLAGGATLPDQVLKSA